MTATTSAGMPPSVGRRPAWQRLDIQGLRAIAVLVVIAYHAGLPIPGGFTGVDMFFVISGYVITELILRQTRDSSFNFLTFYARRAQRLLPALALMVLVVFAVSLFVQSPFGAQAVTAQTGIGAMLIVANVVITRTLGSYFSPAAEANPLLHTWSLSVEEQFYLFFPLVLVTSLAWAARKPKTGNRSTWIPTAVVGLFTFVSFVIGALWSSGFDPLNMTSQPMTWAFYLAPARAWEFGVGALIALAVGRHGIRPPQRWTMVYALMGVVLIALGLWGISASTPFPGFAALVPVLGTGCLLMAGTRSNRISSTLSAAPLVRVGDWSYSLYLWHWPFIVFAVLIWPTPWTPLLAVAVSVLPALLGYHFIENPIRKLRMPRAKVAGLSILGSAVVIAVGLGILVVGPRVIPGYAELNAERQVPTVSEASGCFIQGTFDGPDRGIDEGRECWFRTPGARGWVMLAGDSHAAHASSGLIAAAHSRGLDVFTVTGGACPFQKSTVFYSDVDNCDDLNRFLWSVIDSHTPPLAVLVAAKGVPQETGSTIEELRTRGIPVIWLKDVPRWAPAEQGVQHLPCRGGVLTFDCSFSREEVDTFQEKTLLDEAVLEAKFPDVLVVDPRPLFCDEAVCSPIQDGRLLYVDNEHLNGPGSERLAPLLGAALDKLIVGR